MNRRNQRELLAGARRGGNDDAVPQVEEVPVNAGELWDLSARVIAPVEAATDRPVYDRAILKLFAVAKCSAAQTDAFVAINSRDGRDVGNAMSDSVRRAACVARKKVDRYRAEHGLHDDEDFEAALEDGSLDRTFPLSA